MPQQGRLNPGRTPSEPHTVSEPSEPHAVSAPASGVVRVTEPPMHVVDVSGWTPLEEAEEPLGARTKMWISPGDRSEAWPWKSGRDATRLPEPGADLWAEVIAARAAPLLRVPAAGASLATWDDRHGIISRRVAEGPRPRQRLLSGTDPSYDFERTGPVPGYDLIGIRGALEVCQGAGPG